MDTIATLTSIALQYGVPLESLVKKFAYQRFEPSGFTKNPDIRNATSITDYVFRWLGCQFIKGYKEATSPNKGQADLPMKELAEIDKKAINRPVAELPRETPGIIDIDHAQKRQRRVNRTSHRQQPTPSGCRRLGQYVHGHHLLELRFEQSHPRRRVRLLHRVRHQPGLLIKS